MVEGMSAHDGPPSDEALAAAGDVAGLYARYARRLLAFLAGRLGVPAADLDDVHQDVWVRVTKALRDRAFAGHFRGWLFQVARNRVIDRGRKRREEGDYPEDIAAGEGPTPLDDLIGREERAALERCLGRLDEQEARVLRLRLAGADYDEVCGELGLVKDVAYRLAFEGKRKLTECVERQGR